MQINVLRSIALSLCLAPVVAASPANGLLLDIFGGLPLGGGTEGGCGSGCSPFVTLGYEFSVSSDITVNSIGVWDDFDGGITSTQVGLWDTENHFLASATITSASIPVASENSGGEWLFENITPVTLTPVLAYIIGNTFGPTEPFLYYGPFVDTMPGVNVIQGVSSGHAVGLTEPLGSLCCTAYGPGLSTESFTPVPEPGFTGLAGLGIAAIFLRRVKR